MLCVFLAVLGAARADVFQHPLTAEQLATEVLAEPARLIKEAQVVRGQFVYRKHLSELPAPLESSGEFLFVKNLGIVWHTQTPFDAEFVITAQGVTQRAGGKAAGQAGEQAAVRAAARIFLSLLSLDLDALRASFELYGDKQGERWQMGLKPTAPAVASVLRNAVVGGAAQVETVTLQDANGDRTEIIFKSTLASRSAPSAQDRQRFGP